MLSVILPAYNEEKMIATAAQTLASILDEAGIPFELLFVNDGSKDGTWAEICKAREHDARVRGICFSRNFGKEAAMFAGLEKAAGDCCVVLDCDLQHPPEKIVEMYRLWEQGYEVVEGIKADRGRETGMHRFAANSFYGLISRATGMDMSASSDFKLLDRKVVDTLNAMPERNVFFRALSFWVGFKRAEVHYEVRERIAGESKWSTKSLIRYAITNIGSFSSVPLQLVTVLGIITLVISVIFSVVALVQKITGQALGGFTTVIILLLFIGSLIMISLGIIGYYIARIYEEIKGRPRYIISEFHSGSEETGGNQA
jgi:dolichol-phosphate mannosyltransferase